MERVFVGQLFAEQALIGLVLVERVSVEQALVLVK